MPRAISIVVVIILVSVVIISSFSMTGQSIRFEQKGQWEVEAKNSYIYFTGEYDVISDLSSDIDDVSISVMLVDKINGSSITVFKEDGLTIKSNSSNTIVVDAKMWILGLANILKDLSEQPSFEIPLMVKISGRYMFQLLGFSSEICINFPISADGEKFSLDIEKNGNNSMSVNMSGLRDTLMPDDDRITISADGAVIDIVVDGAGHSLTIDVSTGDGRSFDDCFSAIMSSYDHGGPVVKSDAHGAIDVSKKEMEALRDIILLVGD